MTFWPPDALLSRKFFDAGDEGVLVVEQWDTDHSSCPFVFMGDSKPNPYIDTRIMTLREFELMFGKDHDLPKLDS